MMRKWETWKHISCMDLHLSIIKVLYRDSKRIKLKVFFVDKYGRFLWGQQENVEIKVSELHKWKLVVPSE